MPRGDIDSRCRPTSGRLSIWEHAFSPYQQVTLLSPGNIARTYARLATSPMRSPTSAVPMRSSRSNCRSMSRRLERQKLLFVNSTSERTDRTISLHLPSALRLRRPPPRWRRSCCCSGRGASSTRWPTRSRPCGGACVDPRGPAALRPIKNTTARLAGLALRASGAQPASTSDEHQSGASKRAKERLEAELSAHSAEFRAQAQPVTLEAVQAAIPDDAALPEFALFRPFDPSAERDADAYGPPHYAAYVVRRARWHRAASTSVRPRHRPRRPTATAGLARPGARAREGRAREPWTSSSWARSARRRRLRAASRVSPYGELNLVPFEALVDDRRSLPHPAPRHQLCHERARSPADAGGTREPAARRPSLADPLLGQPAPASDWTPGRGRTSPSGAARGVAVDHERSGMYFAPPAVTAGEARAIKTNASGGDALDGAACDQSDAAARRGARACWISPRHAFFLRATRRSAGQTPMLRSRPRSPARACRRTCTCSGISTALEELLRLPLVGFDWSCSGLRHRRRRRSENAQGVDGLRPPSALVGTRGAGDEPLAVKRLDPRAKRTGLLQPTLALCWPLATWRRATTVEAGDACGARSGAPSSTGRVHSNLVSGPA